MIDGIYDIKEYRPTGCVARLGRALATGLKAVILFAVGFVGGCVFGSGLR